MNEDLEKHLSETPGTAAGSPEKKSSAARTARLVALMAFVTISAWLLPSRYLLCSLAPESRTVELWGAVKRAPDEAPLAGAAIVSDRELAVSDRFGCFHIRAGRGTMLSIEAPGFAPVVWKVSDSRPRVFVLFPVQKNRAR